ncbi:MULTISPECIES: hypothetical protein [Bacillus]|uniref:hypothetical protein n=1 Tax=Bacillus TaxID=1386 RepID=UPI00092B343A|nr:MULTISPECIES: hypothetical protein [Bacillus]MCY8549317.1 hypothetical protein [Bacillus haynesii]OJT57309.1 hypothetical protein BFP47_11410 [Bacillus licheniformis]OJT70049.1 hypothetical protein BFP46_05480 [Bacillus licheniformis]HZH60046.1 hypothetical protein [Metabacillus sp.]
MGSVAIDIHKKERDFKVLTLSDEMVVKYLILFRSKVDTSRLASVNINIDQAGDIFEFNQELISLYASLDKLIEKISFKEKDKQFLNLLFDGHSVSDIIENFDYPRMTAYRTLDRIIARIVDTNEEDWIKSIKVNLIPTK